MQHHAPRLLFQHDDGSGQGGGIFPYFHPGGKLGGLLIGDIGADGDTVDLIDVAGGVHDAVGQLAVIGEEQKSLAVAVQPPDGIDPFLHAGQKVGDTAAPQLVIQGGDVAAGLVHHNVAVLLFAGKIDPPAIHGDHIPVGVDALADFGLMAVDGDPPLTHQFLGGAPGGHSCLAQGFLNTDRLHSKLLLPASLRSF